MNPLALDLQSIRARKARLRRRLGSDGWLIYFWSALILGAAGVGCLLIHIPHVPYILFAAGLASLMVSLWIRGDVNEKAASGHTLNERLSGEVLGLLRPGETLTPQELWRQIRPSWQASFFTSHLLIPPDQIEGFLSRSESDMPGIWERAMHFADASESATIEPGNIVAALLASSPEIANLLKRNRGSESDIDHTALWLGRLLASMNAPRAFFGGIGRDWANGFIPLLNRFGENVSLMIEKYGGHYGWLTDSPGVQAVKNAFSRGANGVALIGDPGIGKTSHAYALAQILLEENLNENLSGHQIISLNPSLILSSATHPGELERIILMLLQEAIHAGHIILFLDDAQLFLRSGTPGAFDISAILLPVLQSRAIQIILALTPHDYQQLKSSNAGFASLLTPVILAEPDEASTLRVLEDTAGNFEAQYRIIIAYEALREANRLSARYDQDLSNPGRSIRLLEQAIPLAQNNFITAAVIQKTVEQTRGVKISTAAAAEASELLHLEDLIHKRMINQNRAVQVVANALRRARAGVSNPKRPIGSFLFLGPTGVGKTELARAIAAIYFGSEANMIRLDMTEFQQAKDVERLLSSGAEEKTSLIMAIRNQPFSVVLLDEIEKAHPNVLNLLLQLLDEAKLTDLMGRAASFKDAVLIATSNAGSIGIRERIERGETLESFEKQFIDELVTSSQFKPELLNRFDEIVLFRPLNLEELAKIVSLMMGEVNATLASQNISVELTASAAQKIAEAGYDPRLGARPLRRELQRVVEDSIAARILSGQTKPGDHVVLDLIDLRGESNIVKELEE